MGDYIKGYVFKNTSGNEFRFDSSDWPEVMKLAMFFGWKPKGTYIQDRLDISDDEDIRKTYGRWDGSYTDNDGQLVTENDAFNLAFALMKAVKVLPDENVTDLLHPLLGSLGHKTEGPVAIYHWSGERKKYLKDFIYFCIGGEFDIR